MVGPFPASFYSAALMSLCPVFFVLVSCLLPTTLLSYVCSPPSFFFPGPTTTSVRLFEYGLGRPASGSLVPRLCGA